MWKVLCHDFFQRYIPPNSVVLEVAAGYCEFINTIHAQSKYAVDINPETQKYAVQGVNVIISSSTKMHFIEDESLDVIFMSNFLEHLDRHQIEETAQECYRILKNGGKLLILQPNIRYLARDFWMFLDHITPIDDRAVCELCTLIGFSSVTSRSKFLPFTTKGKLPKSLLLLKIYLKIPFLHKIFGKQAFITATK